MLRSHSTATHNPEENSLTSDACSSELSSSPSSSDFSLEDFMHELDRPIFPTSHTEHPDVFTTGSQSPTFLAEDYADPWSSASRMNEIAVGSLMPFTPFSPMSYSENHLAFPMFDQSCTFALGSQAKSMPSYSTSSCPQSAYWTSEQLESSFYLSPCHL